MRRVRAMPVLVVFVLAAACGGNRPYEDFTPESNERFESLEAGAHTLFGRPPEDGPISEECCMPTCVYFEEGGRKTWTAPVYTVEDLRALDDWELIEPWPVFEGPEPEPPPRLDPSIDWVCAVLPRPELKNGEGGRHPYELVNFPSRQASEEAGAMVTHRGQCGACSSLRNLAVYIARPNLTEPIRACAITGLIDRDLSRLACIASLGFDLPCAQAWDFNTRSTQQACLKFCGKPSERKAPGNEPFECSPLKLVPADQKLVNSCLACDEEVSLELFRGLAGRSRRGSGLPTAICRRCEGVYRVEHYYRPRDP